MARTRMIKPDFFKNKFLSEVDPYARLLFIGLWGIADREGRLKDDPELIGSELFFRDIINGKMTIDDVDGWLTDLATDNSDESVIIRYTVKDKKCIWIKKFTDHQHVHHREAKSDLPIHTHPDVIIRQGNVLDDKPHTSPHLTPDLPLTNLPASTSTSTSSSSSIAEEEFGFSDKESTICQLIEQLWPGNVVTHNGPGWSYVETISQYTDEAIHEAFATAKTNKVRRRNWDWILERLQNPERYGVKLESASQQTLSYKGSRDREDFFFKIMSQAGYISSEKGYEDKHQLTQEFWEIIRVIDDDKIPREKIVEAYVESNRQGIGGSEQRGAFILKYLGGVEDGN